MRKKKVFVMGEEGGEEVGGDGDEKGRLRGYRDGEHGEVDSCPGRGRSVQGARGGAPPNAESGCAVAAGAAC